MPIPKHLRHFYRGKQYEEFRAQLRARAGDKCEQCRKPNGTRIETVTPLNILGLRMAWRLDMRFPWRDQHGARITRLTYLQALRKLRKAGKTRDVQVVCTAAHLNHVAGDDRPENGRWLCQWCHLNYDLPIHQAHAKETRLTRKDAGRPLLQEAV